jgi:cytochrome c biogenesis protein CcmG, thiol:disulfide interchange protein DsbE
LNERRHVGDDREQRQGLASSKLPACRFIGRYGNPFAAVGADRNGRASIDWGVYGVPETFVVGRDGRIAFKLVGPITPENLERQLKPAIEKELAR